MKRTRWTMRILSGVLLTAIGSGCKQSLVMEPGDYHATMAAAGAVGKVAADPNHPIPLAMPPLPDGKVATPLDPDLPARNLTLKEAIAIALEQGTTGGNALQPGVVNDQLPLFNGRGTTGTDAIRAFAVDPAIAAAEVERSLSKFDARLITSMTWNKVDNPVINFTQNFQNGDQAVFSSSVAKPLPTGGVAGITFSTTYNKLANAPADNIFQVVPQSYTPRVQFQFEQPLLQSFGVEINQLTAAHPGSLLIPGFRSTGQGTEGILITRLRQDQQRAQFDQLINQTLLNVEAAYWNLYAAYFNLAAQEEGLKQALDAYTFLVKRQEVGIARGQLLNQQLAQYHVFRGNVVTARANVLERERILQGLLGIRTDTGERLVPTDEPVLAPYQIDPQDLFREARQFRPELLIIQQELKARQLDLFAQKNGLRPDLRFLGSYDIAGIGRRLDGGNELDNAFRSLTANQFNNWSIGLRLDVPIGFRDANAIVRQAQLNFTRTYVQMEYSLLKVDAVITQRYRTAIQSYMLIETSRSAKNASILQIEADQELRRAGAIGGGTQDPVGFVVALIQAQQNLAAQTAQEFQNIANYNIALAQIEYEKGTIQRYNNVSVNDGPLPGHVQKKAADHFAARQEAIKLRERPAYSEMSRFVNWATPLPESAMPNLPLPQPLPAPQSLGTGALPSPTGGELAPTGPVNPMPPLAAPPLTPPPAPRPMGPPDAMGTPQLRPADMTVGTFEPAGSVVLPPAQPRGPAQPDSSQPAMPAGVPTTPPLSGLPVSTPYMPR